MTGQVKEDLISRLGEMGVAVADGRLGFCPHLVSRGEFMSQARTFHFYGLDGQEHGLRLDPGTIEDVVRQIAMAHADVGDDLESLQCDRCGRAPKIDDGLYCARCRELVVDAMSTRGDA